MSKNLMRDVRKQKREFFHTNLAKHIDVIIIYSINWV